MGGGWKSPPLQCMSSSRSSRPQVFLEINFLKICSKFTGEDQCRSVISVKFSSCLSNFIKITLWHGCSLVNLLHIFRTLFPKSTSGRLLLQLRKYLSWIRRKLHFFLPGVFLFILLWWKKEKTCFSMSEIFTFEIILCRNQQSYYYCELN